MMSRSVLTFLAATVISAPVAIAPALVTPAAAQVEFNLSIGTTVPAAPAPVYEVVPAPRVGYVWAPGAWRWENNRHVWHAGRWDREERHSSRGPWGDRDHDGIPNKYDRHDNRR